MDRGQSASQAHAGAARNPRWLDRSAELGAGPPRVAGSGRRATGAGRRYARPTRRLARACRRRGASARARYVIVRPSQAPGGRSGRGGRGTHSAAPGEVVRIALKTHGDGFLLPRNAIADFFFGVVEDPQGELRFLPVPEDRYWSFQSRGAALRILQSNGIAVASGPPERVQVVCPSESDGRVVARVNVTDRHGNPIRANTVERTVRGAVDSVTVRVSEVGGRSNPVRVNGPPERRLPPLLGRPARDDVQPPSVGGLLRLGARRGEAGLGGRSAVLVHHVCR